MTRQISKALDASRGRAAEHVLREDVRRPVIEPVADMSNTAAPMSRFLTTVEAAVFLKCSPRTLEKLRTIPGRGPKFRRMGNLKGAAVRYCIEDLTAWLAVSYGSTLEE